MYMVKNDAPAAWFKEFFSVVQSLGWIQSKLDPCLYTLRQNSQLVGVLVFMFTTRLWGDQGICSIALLLLCVNDFPTGNGDIVRANFVERGIHSRMMVVFT